MIHQSLTSGTWVFTLPKLVGSGLGVHRQIPPPCHGVSQWGNAASIFHRLQALTKTLP